MTFSEHQKRGLEKARAARVVNEAIDGVLQMFRDEVQSDLPLSRQKGQRVDRVGVPSIDPRRTVVPSWAIETDEFILGNRPNASLLCVITRSVDGFPVELVYADQVVWCRTVEDLEGALGDMLENAKIAAMLKPKELAVAG
ncbi:MAG: hypothetical protein Q8S33_17420 [Myxococcales bacterium]|nr:hypothetical protein [Myxococcales bacterium]MDP3502121.1 hypothetical protein [Myxococcales bacterium]